MSQPRHQHPYQHPRPDAGESTMQLSSGRVIALEGERFGVVGSTGQRYWLAAAFSCLVRPVVGDKVLISLEGADGYILSVLERTIAQPTRLRLDGDLQISVPAGSLSIEARDGVHLDAGHALLVQADQANVVLQSAQLSATVVQASGQRLQSHWLLRHDSAGVHSQKAARHQAEYGDSRRQIQGHEEVLAGSLRQRVKGDWSVQAQSLDLDAQQCVCIDGDQIKLG